MIVAFDAYATCFNSIRHVKAFSSEIRHVRRKKLPGVLMQDAGSSDAAQPRRRD
jgi:hypothetical protein